jgi:predicted  nucleic acid-binding Zn-ribbon protein
MWNALEAVDQVAQKQEELFAVRATVLEQLRCHTVASWSLVICHAKKSLLNLLEGERCTQCWIVVHGVLTEAVNRGGTAFTLYGF